MTTHSEKFSTIRFFTRSRGSAPEAEELPILLQSGLPRSAQIFALEKGLGLKVREIAFASGVSAQTIRNWKRTEDAPQKSGFDDLRSIAEFLTNESDVNPELVGSWIRSRNRDLEFVSPLQAISDGRFDEVLDAARSFANLGLPPDADDRDPVLA